MPVSQTGNTDVKFIDALFTSVSAVCVTGLVTLDPGSAFSLFGRTVIGLLIQIGGLGVATVGVGIILASGAGTGLRGIAMIKESLNINSSKQVMPLFKKILCITFSIEAVGAVLSFFALLKYYPPAAAAGYAVFHSVSAFNNAGFDVFGRGTSLIPYGGDVALNIITMLLIILGGLGFLVMLDAARYKKRRRMTLHSKAVLTTSAALIVFGTLILKLTENMTWLGALFQSVSTRTAGFSSFDFGRFSDAGLFVCVILMLIGASPGSTGGGIKTTTFFTILCSLWSTAKNSSTTAFRRRIPEGSVSKAFTILTLAVLLLCVSTALLCVTNSQNTFIQNFFEAASALGTVGLSTGITAGMNAGGKIILMCAMFTGRLGAFGVATLLAKKVPQKVNYVNETMPIG